MKKPEIYGQAATVLQIIRNEGPVLGVHLNIGHGLTQAGARIHELREAGFNIVSIQHDEITYGGRTRKNCASYVLGYPEWIDPSKGADCERTKENGRVDVGASPDRPINCVATEL
jgi:hypothetical protein